MLLSSVGNMHVFGWDVANDIVDSAIEKERTKMFHQVVSHAE